MKHRPANGIRWGFLDTVIPRSGRARHILLALTMVLAMASSAAADPIRVVTFGSADAHEGDSTFGLFGDGFRFSGEAPGTLGRALGQCVIFLCSPGDVVSLSTVATPHLSTVDITTALWEGETFEDVFLAGELVFDAGSLVVPSLAAGAFTELTAPFAFRGQLSGFDNVFLNGAPRFVANLIGAGTVTLAFENRPEFGVFATRVTYNFEEAAAPVPEPATVLLLGSGLSAILASRRRRR